MRTLVHAVSFAGALLSTLLLASTAHAASVLYTFEPPNFVAGETTPILGVPPNSGPASFLASFTGPGFTIESFQPNVLFSGQSLLQPTGVTGLLTVSFNMPVNQVSLDFAENALTAGGSLTLQTAVGGITVPATLVGGDFPGGVLDFASVTPFSSFTLSALGPTGAPVQFAIDNLALTLAVIHVDEPPAVALLAIALLAIALLAIARRRVPA